MIWNIFFLSLSLVSAINAKPLEAEENHADNSEQRNASPYLTTKVSSLGDIRLTEEQERAVIDFNRYPSSAWPKGVLIYWIPQGQFTGDEESLIRNSLNEMNWRLGRTMVKEWESWDDGGDYVNFVKKNGCWSYLGKTGGEQDLSLGNGCMYKNTIQHEIMHALGFAHTQNRHDRDNHVTILWENISKDWQSQYEKVNNDFINIGEYEHYSIMHYPIWSPSDYRKDAFIIPDGMDRNRVGEGDHRKGVTDEDVRKILMAYRPYF